MLEPKPAPRLTPAQLAGALAASALCGALFWRTWPLYPFKLLVVLMHESGHAFATKLIGGSVDWIRISPDEGGLTQSLYTDTLFHHVVVSSAGYVGSTVSGCVLIAAAARARTGKLALSLLAVWTFSTALLWVRDLFTLGFTLACTVALAVVARFGHSVLRKLLLAFLGAFSVLYSLFDIKDDLLHLHGSSQTDAAALAQVTFIPALVWGVAWGALSLVLVFFTLRAALGGEGRALASRKLPGLSS
jgi:hypothetical protein